MSTSTAEPLLKTPLYDWHKANGGRLVEFGGWSMPVQYASIVEEHESVRKRVGLFDIGHMGRLRFDGPDALAWIQRVTTNDAAKLPPGRIQYSLVCNDQGGVIDDVLVYHLTDGDGYGLVCNASNRLRVVEQFERHRGDLDASLADSTRDTAMIAVQGPAALSTLQTLFDGPPLAEQKYYSHTSGLVLGTDASASRTGYTGEDGFELIVHRDVAEAVWLALLEAGHPRGIRPCGLGARDTLRFEAAMPLYGHELLESINPYAAGLGLFVKLDKGDFVGRDALRRLKDDPGGSRVGLRLQGRRIARQGCPVLRDGQPIGTVTSGTFAPTLQQSLAMALLSGAPLPVGTEVSLDIRGQIEPAEVVPLPFYKRPRPAS
ncbi:glycine cleavage system aminomethyltransferase GcvT [Tautonia sociabilis]|uniref:Aminomethyltransferase n=1 Tax=Tautonia sociabilis TaxID=2080755 RepID=A0A432MP78_9BACT|nr:glycine cleavage system aminomethyltransferase GcvT [Tautonia sociabilis]RUL89212.1 glycine cleavage system aminomethyltransferase GcvT [Tautonia sociabilis]